MRKVFPIASLLLLILISISSCKKNSDSGGGNPLTDFYLRFKNNGVQNEYKAHAEGNFNRASGANYNSIVGATKVQFEATKSNMVVAVTTVGKAALNKTYTNYTTATAGLEKAKLLQLAFYDETGKFFMSWGDEYLSLMPAGSVADARLTITESTSAYIKGTFSGTLFTSGYTSKITITDGEFYLKAN
jgi:hypothetical protein